MEKKSSESWKRARRYLRALELPEDAHKVLGNPKYWSESFLLLYLEEVDERIFAEPAAAIGMAEISPLLARWIPIEKCSGGWLRIKELEVRALVTVGSAHRAIGDLQEAERLYSSALRLARRFSIGEFELSNLYRRMAVLRIDQRQVDEAIALAEKAVDLLRGSPWQSAREQLGSSLAVLGTVRLEAGEPASAVPLFAEALNYIEPAQKSRAYHVALHNLGHALARGAGLPEDLELAARYLREARKLLPGRGKSLPKIKLRWIEALIAARFGSTRQAEKKLRAARQQLVEMGTPFEVAMISLDLSELLLAEGRFTELRELAKETAELCAALQSESEVWAALQFWHEAAKGEKMTQYVLERTRRELGSGR